MLVKRSPRQAIAPRATDERRFRTWEVGGGEQRDWGSTTSAKETCTNDLMLKSDLWQQKDLAEDNLISWTETDLLKYSPMKHIVHVVQDPNSCVTNTLVSFPGHFLGLE